MKEAEDMYLRALAGYEKTWSSEHTSTLDTINNLDHLYSDQDKMKEIENMYLRILIEYEKIWGFKRKRVLDTRYNLKVLYKKRFIFGNVI